MSFFITQSSLSLKGGIVLSETIRTVPIDNNTTVIQEILKKTNELPNALDTIKIADSVTGTIYEFGIKDGKLYYKEVVG